MIQLRPTGKSSAFRIRSVAICAHIKLRLEVCEVLCQCGLVLRTNKTNSKGASVMTAMDSIDVEIVPISRLCVLMRSGTSQSWGAVAAGKDTMIPTRSAPLCLQAVRSKCVHREWSLCEVRC